MHPNKKEGVAGHNSKLRRMTRGYGAANPAMHRDSPTEKYTGMGGQDAVGYGAEGSAAPSRSDRAVRRTKAANPVATYKHGGKVRHRAAGGGMPMPAKKGKGKSGGKTNINITMMPHTGAGAPPPPAVGANPTVPPAAMPPRPPMGGMPMGGAPGGMPPGGLGAMAMQNQLANQLPRKRGGRVHSDAKEDRKLVKSMVKGDALKHRKAGGKVGLTGGAESGEGRLERNRAMRGAKGQPTRGVEG